MQTVTFFAFKKQKDKALTLNLSESSVYRALIPLLSGPQLVLQEASSQARKVVFLVAN